MSLPAGVIARPVHLAAPSTHAGDPLAVSVTIEPSHTVVHAATGTALPRMAIESTAESGTGLVLYVPATDQAGFIDTAGNAFTGWSYTARIKLLDAQGKAEHLVKKFSIPSALADLDLMLVPGGNPAAPVISPTPQVLSVAGLAGVITAEQITEAQGTYQALAADPSRLFIGPVTLDAGGAPTAAAVVWPDGVQGEYTGVASATFAGAVDSFTVTHGGATYAQPTVTRDAAGNITNRPAITIEETP